MERRFFLPFLPLKTYQKKDFFRKSLTLFYSFLAAFLLLVSFTQISFAVKTYAKFEPPEGKKLVIIGQDNETIANYIDSIKIVPAGFMVYTCIQKMEGLDSESPDYGSGIINAEKLIKKYPNTVLQIGLYMVDALQDTYNGRYDGNIKKLAIWLKKISIPVFLRIGYECDGLHNHYDPENYKKAYSYIVDKLRMYNVNNVAYVWHVHAHNTKPELNKWYPGDNYVDWIGFSYFNQPQRMMDPVINFAKNHQKPVMVAEGTPKGVGSKSGECSWNLWYNNFFSFIEEHKIKAFSYINSDWEKQEMWRGKGWEDARIQASDYVKERWHNEIEKDKYLKSSKDLFALLGKDR